MAAPLVARPPAAPWRSCGRGKGRPSGCRWRGGAARPRHPAPPGRPRRAAPAASPHPRRVQFEWNACGPCQVGRCAFEAAFERGAPTASPPLGALREEGWGGWRSARACARRDRGGCARRSIVSAQVGRSAWCVISQSPEVGRYQPASRGFFQPDRPRTGWAHTDALPGRAEYIPPPHPRSTTPHRLVWAGTKSPPRATGSAEAWGCGAGRGISGNPSSEFPRACGDPLFSSFWDAQERGRRSPHAAETRKEGKAPLRAQSLQGTRPSAGGLLRVSPAFASGDRLASGRGASLSSSSTAYGVSNTGLRLDWRLLS